MPPNPDPIFFPRCARPPRDVRPSPAACAALRAASPSSGRGLQPRVLLRCGFPIRSPSGRGLSVACFLAPPSSRTTSAQLFFCCSCNQVAVATSSWLVLWSVSGAEADVFFPSLRPLKRCSRGNCVLTITSHYLSPCHRLVPLLSILFLMVKLS
jgi:hypothetical protein